MQNSTRNQLPKNAPVISVFYIYSHMGVQKLCFMAAMDLEWQSSGIPCLKIKRKKYSCTNWHLLEKKILKSIESRGCLLDKEFIQEMASIISFNMIVNYAHVTK